jgi:hypothetical protein
MKELTLGTLIAVFEEIFGAACFGRWLRRCARHAGLSVRADPRPRGELEEVPSGAAVDAGRRGAGGLVRDGGDRFSFADIGGPVDVIVLLGIAVLGAIGMAILVYTLESLVRRRSVAGGEAS